MTNKFMGKQEQIIKENKMKTVDKFWQGRLSKLGNEKSRCKHFSGNSKQTKLRMKPEWSELEYRGQILARKEERKYTRK